MTNLGNKSRRLQISSIILSHPKYLKVKVVSSIPSRGRLGLTLAIIIMVITLPILMLANPTQVSAATIDDNSNRIDSSGYHSTPSIPAGDRIV